MIAHTVWMKPVGCVTWSTAQQTGSCSREAPVCTSALSIGKRTVNKQSGHDKARLFSPLLPETCDMEVTYYGYRKRHTSVSVSNFMFLLNLAAPKPKPVSRPYLTAVSKPWPTSSSAKVQLRLQPFMVCC